MLLLCNSAAILPDTEWCLYGALARVIMLNNVNVHHTAIVCRM